MKIALYGIGGTYNFGCEAIVRGTEIIIHKKYPNAEIDYYSYKPEDDIQRLSGVNVKVCSIYNNELWSYLSKCFYKCDKIMQSIFSKYNGILFNTIVFGWVKKYDYILSIGGDIYTLPPASERVNENEYTNQLLEFGKYCKAKNKKFIIWGASIGPFDDCEPIKQIFFDHFNNCVYKMTIRGPFSLDYLKKNDYFNFLYCSDPAFVIEDAHTSNFNTKTQKSKKLIGINLSPLSNIYSNAELSEESRISLQANTIKEIVNVCNCDIVLLPHVLSEHLNDDDYTYLLKIKNKLNELNIEVDLIKCNSFLEVKAQIRKCNLVISARMHCAINSIASLVPTIFLSYSDKSISMSKLIYDSLEYSMSIESFNDSEKTAAFVKTVLDDELQIKGKLIERLPQIKESSYKNADIFEMEI